MTEPGLPTELSLTRTFRHGWWLVGGVPVLTTALATLFVFLVQPLFEATTTLRFTGDQSPFGGSAAALGEATGGLSMLASLAGREREGPAGLSPA